MGRLLAEIKWFFIGTVPMITLQPRTPYQGVISRWNDQSGYGFIRLDNSNNSVYFHISSYGYEHSRPEEGDRVVFYAHWNEEKKKYSATRVLQEEDEKALPKAGVVDFDVAYEGRFSSVIFSVLILFYFFALFWAKWEFAAAILIISGLTFSLYRRDKWYALIKKKFRIPETDLYISALLGGWPGAIVARRFYRHKISKSRFMIFFWACMVLNTVVVFFLIRHWPTILREYITWTN